MSKQIEELKVGDAVLLTGDREGIIRYIGNVQFSSGIWYGIELSGGALGSCDGAVKGRRYFQTEFERGIFVRATKIGRKLRKKDLEYGIRQKRKVSLQIRLKNESISKIPNVDLYLDNLSSTTSESPLSTPPPTLDKKQSDSSNDKITPKSTYSNSNKDFEFDPPSRPQSKYEDSNWNQTNNNNNNNQNLNQKKQTDPEQKIGSDQSFITNFDPNKLYRARALVPDSKIEDLASKPIQIEPYVDYTSSDEESYSLGEDEGIDIEDIKKKVQQEDSDFYNEEEEDDDDEEINGSNKPKEKKKKEHRFPRMPVEPNSDVQSISEYDELLDSVFNGKKNLHLLPRRKPKRFESEDTDRLIGGWDVFFNNGLKGEYSFDFDENLRLYPSYLHAWNKPARVKFDSEKKIYIFSCEGVECFVQAILADKNTLVLEYYDKKDTLNIVTGIGKRN